MTLEEIRPAVNAQPFVPLRLLVNERWYDIRRRDQCMLGLSTMFIGIPRPGPPADLWDHAVLVGYAEIVRVEPLVS